MTGFESPNTTITSYYNWSPDPVSSTSTDPVDFPFIPMLWGCNSTYFAPFEAALNASFAGANLTGQREVLGFNEPEQAEQSDCTPQQAADAWMTYLEPLRSQGYRLGSPAVTTGSTGNTWLLDWYAACNGGCNPDFLALHWYDMSYDNLVNTLDSFHTTFNLPIWITEMAVQNFTTVNSSTTAYGAQATYSEIVDIMNATMAYMDAQDWVERYFWFGAMYDMQGVNPLDSLFLSSGESRRTGGLNELGVMYAGSNGTLATARWAGTSGASRRTGRVTGLLWTVLALMIMLDVTK
ncbi:hypothetical protein Q5752_002097 [Cryptotrichosporon argae]